jgi:hypothetical protein
MTHLFEQAGLGEAPYEYLGCVDTGRSNTSCQFCNTKIRYEFHLKSKDGKKFFVGSDCIYKSGDAGLTKLAKFERKRIAKEQREAKNKAEYEKRNAERQAKKEQKIENFFKENEAIQYILDWAKNSTGLPKQIYANIQVWGSLTDKQIELLCDLYYKENQPKKNCPQGEHTIQGTVQSFKWTPGYYGKMTHKMIVETIEGYRVYGTVPANLENLEVGDCVRFVANITPSDNDGTFGFYSRPKKSEYLGKS